MGNNHHYSDKYSFAGIPKPTDFGMKRKMAWPNKYINKFLFDLNQNVNVLEIGPGMGEFADECRRRNWQYLGIESSQTMLESLKIKKIKLINARIPPIPVSNESFDLIHASQVIEHFNNVGEFTFFLQECWRSLRAGGYLSLTCPNYLTIGNIFYDLDYTHRLAFTKFNLVRAFNDYQFDILRNGYFLNLTLSDNLFMKLSRHPLIFLTKMINNPLIIEISEKYKFLHEIRLRTTKNLMDNIVVIAKKKQ